MRKTVSRRFIPIAGALVLSTLVVAVAAAAGVTTETADVIGQGPTGGVVSEDGAVLRRSDNGLSVKVTMPTPEPGSYSYPVGAAPGHPEAFSLWAFVFNFPELCSDGVCGSDDVFPLPDGSLPPARGGAFNAAGHILGSSRLVLSGHVATTHSPFVGSPLANPKTAEVHLAVAPHGQLDPALLPDQIKKPIGSPPFWWLALFQ